MRTSIRAGLTALANLDPTLPRYTASKAYLCEKAGDTEAAAALYAEAAAQAYNVQVAQYRAQAKAQLE